MEKQLAELQRQLKYLQDKDAIREKLMVYARFCDRLDREVGRAVFAEDAECNYGPNFSGTGWQLVEWMIKAHQYFTATQHQMTNMLINVDGDKASSETYHYGICYSDRDPQKVFGTISLSRYMDKWECRDGDWVIVKREVVSDVSFVPVIAKGNANYGQFSRDENDLGYQYYQLGK